MCCCWLRLLVDVVLVFGCVVIVYYMSICIFGIDLGSQCIGVGIIDVDVQGKLLYVFYGVLVVVGEVMFLLCLKCIFDGLCDIIVVY